MTIEHIRVQKIGDTRTAPCPECQAPLTWRLRQRLVGPEGMRDATAIWAVDEHFVGGVEREPTEDEPVAMCNPQAEAVFGDVEGVLSEDQRAVLVRSIVERQGGGYSPWSDPVFTPAGLVQWGDPNITCVMPTTAKRAWCIGRSIQCWLRQSYTNRDLLIVSDGERGDGGVVRAVILESLGPCQTSYLHSGPQLRGPVIDRATFEMTDGVTIRHEHLSNDPTRTLGRKYNECINLAHGPFVALWADDDWHHPRRLEAVMRAMQTERVPVGGTNTMLAYRHADQQAFLFWTPTENPYLIGGTLCFSKAAWETSPFPEIPRGSDSGFIRTLLMTGIGWAALNDPRLYCAFLHGDNTGNPLGDAPISLVGHAGGGDIIEIPGELETDPPRIVRVYDKDVDANAIAVPWEGDAKTGRRVGDHIRIPRACPILRVLHRERLGAFMPLEGKEADMTHHLGQDAKLFGF